jgi:hypothetical protein
MAKRKLIDLTGAPFIVEKADNGQYYIIGIKLRHLEFLFKNGIPEDVVERLEGVRNNGRIDGIDEIEEFLGSVPEGSTLEDELVLDEDPDVLDKEIDDIFFPDGVPE